MNLRFKTEQASSKTQAEIKAKSRQESGHEIRVHIEVHEMDPFCQKRRGNEETEY